MKVSNQCEEGGKESSIDFHDDGYSFVIQEYDNQVAYTWLNVHIFLTFHRNEDHKK